MDNQPLSTAERSLLLEQSELIAFVEEALKTIHEVNEGAERRQLGIIENPQKSWLWDFDFMKLNQRSLDTADVEAWTDVDYLACFREASRPRSKVADEHALGQEALSVGGMTGVQCHDHHLQEVGTMEHMSRRVGHARTGREGVSCKIVWQMAVAISCETTKKLQFRLSMPRSPALQPLVRGDRSW